MKFFLDTTKKQLVKSAASNVALDRLVLKRRDSLAVEVAFVARGAVASMPSGTTTNVALKKTFADANFLALASGTPPTLNLNTVPLEGAFAASPASISALLEIRWSIPGETTRTATLAVEIQNSVIIGTEGTPEAIPDGKATQAQAEAGTDNEKWMTPLRTKQAIALLAPPPTWDSVTGKPATFPPSTHTHTASQITDFAAAVALVAPPTTDASLLTSGTLPDARLSSTIARTIDLTTEQNARIAGDTALGQRIDFLAANLDPAALDSIAEAAASIGTLQTALDGKATAAQGAKADTALQPEPVSYLGAYNNGGDYSPGQVVSFNGALYIRTGEPNPGYPPGTSYWAEFDPAASPAFKLWVDLSKADTVHTHTAAQITDFASAVVAVSPPVDWSILTGKPSTFAPSAHTQPATSITGLSDFIIASAPGLSITTTTHIADGLTDTYSVGGLASADPSAVLVSLNGVTQNPGVDYMVNLASGTIIFDDYPASGQQIVFTALGLRSVQPPLDPTLYLYAFDQSANGLTTYSGRLLNANRPAAPALPEAATSWTIRRTTLNAAGRVLSTATATGSWLNRETLDYA